MNGQYIYFVIAALLGVLCSLVNFTFFFMLASVYLVILIKYKKFTKSHILFLITLFILFFTIAEQKENVNITKIPAATTAFLLEYNDIRKIDGDLLQIPASEKRYGEKILIRYKIKSEQEKEALKNLNFYGRLCKVNGVLTKPSIAKNPNGFDYRNYLAAKQTFWIVEIENNPLENCSPLRPSLLNMLKQIRFRGIQYLEAHFPSEIASLSAALIFGDRSMIEPDLIADYQKTGIVHLLAISGLHVSLLVAMVFYIGIRIGMTRQFMMSFLLAILPIYVVLTGGSPSVTRSVLMIFLVLLTVKWKRKIKLLPIDAISLACLLYLFCYPYVIFDVGFQLSFVVCLSIILSASQILKGCSNSLSQMLVTSMISQLAAFPLLLYHYFELSLISIAANLLYIPLYSFVFLPGLYLLYFIQLLLGKSPSVIIQILSQIIHLSNDVIKMLATIPFVQFTSGRPNWFLLILYIFIIIAIFLNLEAGLFFKKGLMLMIGFLFSIQICLNWLNPVLEVTMIDVGQGDSIFIRLPFHQGNYLIDTGGTVTYSEEPWKKRSKPFEVGRDVVVPYLKGKGITKIDMLILTHGDMDHIGGAIAIIKALNVKQILLPSIDGPSDTELQIIEEAKKQGTIVRKTSEGEKWRNGEASFFILSPEKNFTGERNRGSIAIFAEIGGLRWFFGGDLDQEGEERIIKKYPQLKVDVLKVGHHGSKTSSAEGFINQIHPRVALISVGEKNRFGHPHQEVLDKLRRLNCKIYRTDQEGAITYRFYHGKGTFSPYLP